MAANEVFRKLPEPGIQLQINDFGSGYSALGFLISGLLDVEAAEKILATPEGG